MKLTLARPQHAERLSRFYASVHDQSFPHQELLSPPTLTDLLRQNEVAIVIATHKRSILGCGLAFVTHWNEALEIGVISVAPDAPKGDVSRALFEALRRLGIKNYGVVFFRAQGKKGFQRGRKAGASCWGYRPLPGGRTIDQAELIMGFPHPQSDEKRAEPPVNAITTSPFAARIIKSISGSEKGIPYPKSYPVGCPKGTGAPVISGRIWPTYHSRGNFINIENAAGAYPVEIVKEFQQKVEKKGVNDLRLTLPVNQEEAYFELLGHGFRPVAYLPGWFLRGAHRFDCLQMVSGVPPMPREPKGFTQRAVARIDNELHVT